MEQELHWKNSTRQWLDLNAPCRRIIATISKGQSVRIFIPINLCSFRIPSCGGKINSPIGQSIFWVLMACFADAMLLSIGGRQALQIMKKGFIITIMTVLLIME